MPKKNKKSSVIICSDCDGIIEAEDDPMIVRTKSGEYIHYSPCLKAIVAYRLKSVGLENFTRNCLNPQKLKTQLEEKLSELSKLLHLANNGRAFKVVQERLQEIQKILDEYFGESSDYRIAKDRIVAMSHEELA